MLHMAINIDKHGEQTHRMTNPVCKSDSSGMFDRFSSKVVGINSAYETTYDKKNKKATSQSMNIKVTCKSLRPTKRNPTPLNEFN